jgi:hypothetical protein
MKTLKKSKLIEKAKKRVAVKNAKGILKTMHAQWLR